MCTKLKGYGFDSLEFMKNYLTNRKQRCKFRNCFSEKLHQSCLEVPYLNPYFLILSLMIYFLAKNSTFSNYADDNTHFSSEKTFDQVITNLQTDFRTLKVWLHDNFLVLNPKRCYFMALGNGNNLCDF